MHSIYDAAIIMVIIFQKFLGGEPKDINETKQDYIQKHLSNVWEHSHTFRINHFFLSHMWNLFRKKLYQKVFSFVTTFVKVEKIGVFLLALNHYQDDYQLSMNQFEGSERQGFFLFMKEHWASIKAEGLTTSFALTYLHNRWRSLSEEDKNRWKSAASMEDLTQMFAEFKL